MRLNDIGAEVSLPERSIAMLVMLFAMKQAFFDVHLIAGARDGAGIGLQMLAGGIGGWVFAKISQRPEEHI